MCYLILVNVGEKSFFVFYEKVVNFCFVEKCCDWLFGCYIGFILNLKDIEDILSFF